MRDLLHIDGADPEEGRKKVEYKGWGCEILSRQDGDGKWSGQLYDKKWVSTTYALLMLKEYDLLSNERVLWGADSLSPLASAMMKRSAFPTAGNTGTAVSPDWYCVYCVISDMTMIASII